MNIYPYKMGSTSAKDLAERLGVKRLKHKGSTFKGSPGKVVLNWGASSIDNPEVLKCKIINHPDAVKFAANKLNFFKANAVEDGARIPPFSEDQEFIKAQLAKGQVVIARTILNGNSGQGIVVMEKPEDFVEAPLYTLYVNKKQEYRVHVFNGEVLDVQRKARRKDVADEEVNWKIRNHANGFIFARGEALGDVPQDVLDQAQRAVAKVGLDFGAVDVIFNDHEQKAYVLEVNCAPGLSGTTLDNYVEVLQ